MLSRTKSNDISWRMSTMSCAACALFLTGGIVKEIWRIDEVKCEVD